MKNGESLKNFLFKADTKPVTYVVIVTPAPKSIYNADPVSQLDGSQQGMIGSSNGKLQKREEIQLGPYRGRDITTSMASGRGTGRYRFYFTRKMFYVLLAAGLKEPMQKQNAEIDKVFDSFRVLPQ